MLFVFPFVLAQLGTGVVGLAIPVWGPEPGDARDPVIECEVEEEEEGGRMGWAE